jgi:hypothetical protein
VYRPPSPPTQDQELQGNKEFRSPSPPAEVPALQDTKGKRLGSLLAKDKELQDLHLHPSTKQPELLPNTDRVPSTQQPIYETAKGSSSSGFFVSGQKAQNIDKNACR